ncbi:hypothetical protein D3C81_1010000 [compost metagenome]
MLIRTFQIQIGRLAEATLQQHALVGDARVEPDIEDVGDLFVLRRFLAQQLGRIQRIPDIDAAGLHAVGDLLHQLDGARMRLAGFAMGEQCDRHAPGALAADAPVRAAIDHAADARLAPAREPAHVVDRGHRVAAQVGLVHRDEPLRRGAEHHRRLVAPAMRVAVLDLDECQQRTGGAQRIDDQRLRLPQVHAGQLDLTGRRRRRQIHATTIDRIDLASVVLIHQPVLLADHEILLTVTGRGMHRTGTVFVGDVVTVEQRDVAVGVERMRQQLLFQRRTLGMTVHDQLGHAVAGQRTLGQRRSQHQPARLAVVGRAFGQHVVDIRPQRHRQRSRQRPRRGGPDRHSHFHTGRQFNAEAGRQRLRIARGVSHVDGRRGLVLIFDFRFSQGRAAVEAPMHRLGAAHDVAVGEDLGQRADFIGFEIEAQCLVRVVPVTDHTQALEIAALDIDLLFGVLAALLAELFGIQLDADLAPLLFDRDLDRQAVAIPARHVGCIKAGQVTRLDDDVLEDLVDRVAQMDLAVGIRRAVVQHEQRAAFGVLAKLRVDALLFPLRQDARLTLGQVAAHREFRCRQMEGGFVILAHAVARNLCSERMRRACSASRCICSVSAGRSLNFSSSRSLATNSTSMWRP